MSSFRLLRRVVTLVGWLYNLHPCPGWGVIGLAPSSFHGNSFRQRHNLCGFDVCEVKGFCLIVWIIEVLLFSVVLCSYTINQNCNNQPLRQGGKDAADTWRKTDRENRGTVIFFYITQLSSVTQSGPTLCNPMDCSMPGLPVHHQLPEFTQTHVHWAGDAIQPSHPLHPLLLQPSIFPSIRVFSNESVHCIKWPKYCSFSFNISP